MLRAGGEIMGSTAFSRLRGRARGGTDRNRRMARIVIGVGVTGSSLLTVSVLGTAPSATASTPSFSESWATSLPDTGNPIALSSPIPANLDGTPSVVVGDRSDNVWALHLSNGSRVAGWPFNAGAPVDSTPSVAAINPNGLDTVFVGSGDAAKPLNGGYQAIAPNGADQWFVPAVNPSTDPNSASGVSSSLTVGDLQGGTDVVAGSLGQNMFAMQATNGSLLSGFPWFQADSVMSTAAIADLYSNGQNEIIDGGDSTAGTAYGTTYQNGGHLRILSAAGNTGTGAPGGGLICQYNTDQNIAQSSPAVGQFLSGDAVGIVFGTGDYYSEESATNDLIALDSHCNQQWVAKLDGVTTSSPALADVLGNGQLQVVEGTNINNANSSGSVWVLNGATGQTIWHAAASGAVIGSVTTADLTNSGYQDLLVPTTAGVDVFDGKSGNLITVLAPDYGFQNAPLVTDDADGTIGITLAGYFETSGQLQGIVEHFEVPGSNGSLVDELGAWPMFHHDPQLSGDAGTPSPRVEVPCTAPASAPAGYLMAATDGGVFNYGNLPFCGSLGNLVLNQPVVGIEPTKDGGGYWLVARDGGIFAFGDATFYGSMGGKHLNAPIVGMAVTPDGRGYWEVASDGGIFSFGDARYYGSTGALHLAAPVVGMAIAPSGNGYWLVGSDGGIFAFGGSRFSGSMGGKALVAPIVAVTSDPLGGYWEVASDGGIFSFGGATYYGSMGGKPLLRPIVGMESATSGHGYRLVASDGGIFSFGTAPFLGSMGGQPLNAPIVGIAGT
jgi:hypothetical protein